MNSDEKHSKALIDSFEIEKRKSEEKSCVPFIETKTADQNKAHETTAFAKVNYSDDGNISCNTIQNFRFFTCAFQAIIHFTIAETNVGENSLNE